MGDDEGAAYWETVYGQPIHTYPDEKQNEETGELEKMSEEEYIAFVRRGMWERSWEGTEAQREERRRRERLSEEKVQKTRSRSTNREAGSSQFEREVEESLRRGQERKERKMWREKWDSYESAWETLHRLVESRNTASGESKEKTVYFRNEIVWPVESGKRKDLTPEEIEQFMVKTAESLTSTSNPENGLRQLLKVERVRWHPDKVQHRFGSLNIDEGTLRGVTEVFQVIDRLYNERK
jgi:hypothetical protein